LFFLLLYVPVKSNSRTVPSEKPPTSKRPVGASFSAVHSSLMENLRVFFVRPWHRFVDRGGSAVEESFGQVKGVAADNVAVAVAVADLRGGGVGETLGALSLLLPPTFVAVAMLVALVIIGSVAAAADRALRLVVSVL
jgi:hypothetical protein